MLETFKQTNEPCQHCGSTEAVLQVTDHTGDAGCFCFDCIVDSFTEEVEKEDDDQWQK